jgi:dTDP-4-dehydrorhamnose reductase
LHQPETTWFGFANTIFKQAGGFDNLKLNAINTSDYAAPVRHSQNSVLDCAKLNKKGCISKLEAYDLVLQTYGL